MEGNDYFHNVLGRNGAKIQDGSGTITPATGNEIIAVSVMEDAVFGVWTANHGDNFPSGKSGSAGWSIVGRWSSIAVTSGVVIYYERAKGV